MQNHYSLVYREEEREMFPTLKLFSVGSIPWSPLGRGKLTRPLGADTKRGKSDACVSFHASSERSVLNEYEYRYLKDYENSASDSIVNRYVDFRYLRAYLR